ncbi:STAS domain-containing protein [Streptomyces xylophagus]|uniref:hypothetical protein n=1 Tax=Streptomyces xylophagus TaxID=285514 RepID=UPI00068E0F22|nr:hypothetical protein [Streptomyces xylophagus]
MPENHTRSAPSRTVRSIDGATAMTWHGGIDLVTAIPPTSHLDALTSGPHPDPALGLRSVSFIDCSGLSVLCRTRNRVRARSEPTELRVTRSRRGSAVPPNPAKEAALAGFPGALAELVLADAVQGVRTVEPKWVWTVRRIKLVRGTPEHEG